MRPFRLSFLPGVGIAVILLVLPGISRGAFSVDEPPREMPLDPGDAWDTWGTVVIDDGDGAGMIDLMVPDPLGFDLDALGFEEPDDPYQPADGAFPGLLISFDDADPGPGAGPPDRPLEIYFVDLTDVFGFGMNAVLRTTATERNLGLGTNPGETPADDDLDALDARETGEPTGMPVLFSCDAPPADGGLGLPGVIFRGGIGAPPEVFADPAMLGLDARSDIDALAMVRFEGGPYPGQIGVLFSVDENDPGGLAPGDLYFSALDGRYELFLALYGDSRDIDAVSVNAAGPFEVLDPEPGQECYKWRQPPDMIRGVNLWSYRVEDLMSEPTPFIADDFISDGRPITDIHWWGSYENWQEQTPFDPRELPPVRPMGFMLNWYADIPAGIDPEFPYSHPGELIAQGFFPIEEVGETYFGTVTNSWLRPGMEIYEHEYVYRADLRPEPWMEQSGETYWLGIRAIFPPGAIQDPEFRAWGWKTTQPAFGWNDDAVLSFSEGAVWDLELIYPTPFYPETHPYTGRSVDMAFGLTTWDCPDPFCMKWERPLDLVYGIDVESWAEQLALGPFPMAADDFVSDGRPIRRIQWFGSYPGWMIQEPDPRGQLPPVSPAAFELRWWTDVPAGSDPEMPWSHPGELLDVRTFSLEEVAESYAGTVFDPLKDRYEHKYSYTADLGAEPWREKAGRIYWLSVRAFFPPRSPDLEEFLPWGWATTPVWMNFNDDAALTFDQGTFWEDLHYRDLVPDHPTGDRSVNLAFRLWTDICPRRCEKWSRPPDMRSGQDFASWGYAGEPAQTVMADDFISDGRRITDIHWWGSYLDWRNETPDPVDPPPVGPIGFRIGWYTDVPAGVDPEIPWSHPGEKITEVFCPIGEANETYYGSAPQAWIGDLYWEHVFQYYCDLETFWPEKRDEIYWLEIVAVFDRDQMQQGESRPWGWHSTPLLFNWNDAAVAASPGLPWTERIWYGGHPYEGNPVNLAFELTTDQLPGIGDPVPFDMRIGRWTDDAVVIRWRDVVGCGTYVLQSADLLDNPTGWTDLYTNTVPVSVNRFLDEIPAGTDRRFYRLQLRP